MMLNNNLASVSNKVNRFMGGLTSSISIPANSNYTSDLISFGVQFPHTPAIVANVSGTFNANEVSHSIVSDVSTSGFKFRVRNLYSTALNIKVSWMAYDYT